MSVVQFLVNVAECVSRQTSGVKAIACRTRVASSSLALCHSQAVALNSGSSWRHSFFGRPTHRWTRDRTSMLLDSRFSSKATVVRRSGWTFTSHLDHEVGCHRKRCRPVKGPLRTVDACLFILRAHACVGRLTHAVLRTLLHPHTDWTHVP